MKRDNQLNLGELIDLVRPIAVKNAFYTVIYDFGHNYPKGLDSWRGSYDELALDYVDTYPANCLNVKEFLALLESALERTFGGYKGGRYDMNNSTPLWVANYGNSGHTSVSGIFDNGYQLIILTSYNEY